MLDQIEKAMMLTLLGSSLAFDKSITLKFDNTST